MWSKAGHSLGEEEMRQTHPMGDGGAKNARFRWRENKS